MKALDATCAAGVVLAGIRPVVGAEILSEGVGASQGVLLLDEGRKVYIAKISGDLKTSIDKLATALGQIASALTAIDGKATGTLPPVPVATTAIAAVTAIQTELNVLKEILK